MSDNRDELDELDELDVLVDLDDVDRVMRAGLDSGLRQAMANLYRVYTSPGHATDYEQAFVRGAKENAKAYARMIELLEELK